MKLFGYGSLMDEHSLRATAPDARIIDVASLAGYKRVFDLESSSRRNKLTDLHACVLNIREDSSTTITGVLIELSEARHEELLLREERYTQEIVTLTNGVSVSTFIAHGYKPYPYKFGDTAETEYLQMCLNAADSYGFKDNFLHSTFIEDKSLSELGFG